MFKGFIILFLVAVRAELWPDKCKDVRYVQTLRGERLFINAGNCIIDGIILKLKLKPLDEYSPFERIPISPITSDKCTFPSILSENGRDQENTVFNCLIRRYHGVDASSIETDELKAILQQNALDIAVTATDDYHKMCDDRIDDLEVGYLEDEPCILLETLKHYPEAQGYIGRPSSPVSEDNPEDGSDEYLDYYS